MKFVFGEKEEGKKKFNWIRAVDWILLILMIYYLIQAKSAGTYDEQTIYVKCEEVYPYSQQYNFTLPEEYKINITNTEEVT